MKLNFNAANVEPNAVFEPLPPNWYVVQIIGSEGKPTKSEDGGYLELKLQVLEGEFKNRVLFDRLNLENKNKQTVQIAEGTLSSICRSVGVIQMQDTQELHGKPLLAKVAIRPATGTYAASNDVKGYKALEGAGAPAMPGAGVGGNVQGVPTWAGGTPAAETQAASATTVVASPEPEKGGYSFGGLKGWAASAASNSPTTETPKWAQPAGAQS